MVAIPMIEEKVHELFSRDVSLGCNDVDVGTRVVSDGDNAVMPIILGEWADEVNSDALTMRVWDGQRVERPSWHVGA